MRAGRRGVQERLEDIRAAAEDALAFSSGMSAIATLLLTFCRPGDVIVHSGPLYAATETLIAKILGQFGITWLDFPSGATGEEIAAVVEAAKAKGRVAMIYLESPANPTIALVDVEAVRAVRDSAFPDASVLPSPVPPSARWQCSTAVLSARRPRTRPSNCADCGNSTRK